MQNVYQQVELPETSTLVASLQSFSRKASLVVTLVGGVVFLGWSFDIATLKSILPGLVTMKTNTAIAFMLGGVSLRLWHQKNKAERESVKNTFRLHPLWEQWQQSLSLRVSRHRLAQVSAIIVLLIGLLTLVEYGFNWDLGIDQLVFQESLDAVGTYAPNRMAPNTALNFLLLGSAEVLLLGSRPNYRPAQILTLLAFLIALLGLLGYLYGITSFYGIGSYTRMAVHTAVAFLLLSLGVLFACPNQGVMAVLISKDAGGLMARRLSPAAIAIPPILGWFILSGYRSKIYDPETGLSLLGIFNLVIFAVLIWSNAKFLSAVDLQRKQAEKALKQSYAELEQRVEERTVQLQQANTQLQSQIAERISTEAALQESYNLLQTVIESTPDSIYVKNLQGYFVMVNSTTANIFGKPVAELIGKNNTDLLPPELAHPLTETDRRIMMTGVAETVEEILPKKGIPSTYLVTKSPWLDTQGHIIGLIGIGRDITERKQAEEAVRLSEALLRDKNQQLEHTLQELQHTQSQLIQSEKMSSLGQLVAGIAHEINNPVNFIYGNLTYVREYTEDLLKVVQLYQQYYPSPSFELQDEIAAIELDFLIEDFPNLLSSMKIGADRIREIVLSLRNFSRIDESDMKEVDIHEGIDSTLMILHNRLKAKPEHPAIQVMKNYGNLPLIECYAGQLNQVFMNILTNAIDALDDYNKKRKVEEIKNNPSAIEIRTELKQGRSVAIAIKDNGPGMTEDVKRQLFNPFFTTKPIGKGTGLGLAISYQIVVEKHGGRLECISAPGQGAEFLIEIPLRQ